VAYAPADDPQYAVIIIVDEPTQGSLYGSTVAAPYVGNLMETILPYLGVTAVYTEEELNNMTVTVPNCLYWSVSAATRLCEESGYQLTVEVVGDPDGVVYRQYPEAGTVVEKTSGRIILYTERAAEPKTVKVPDVTGMSAVAANRTLINAGLNIRIRGTKNYLSGTGAVVITQSVESGTEVPKGTVVEVTFRYLDDTD
jgi:stage V sporulation protein D (sporulation-specific penicillin-binding protein)